MVLPDKSTPEKRAIWADVEKVAADCPEWVKPMVQESAAELAHKRLRQGYDWRESIITGTRAVFVRAP